MTLEKIKTQLKYAHLQIAAEALYGMGSAAVGEKNTFPNIALDVLTQGNGRSSKFTPTDAAWFTDTWEVIAHQSNTRTGFSGTLFKAKKDDPERAIQAGELVLSFRSTEFADDAARDNQATNIMEVKKYGWAFGQIADMQAWYEYLQDTGKIDGPFVVTGYSLGGHLATSFYELYPGAASATYTFNGAGVGKLKEGIPNAKTSLNEVLEFFNEHRIIGSNADSFTDPYVLNLYHQLKDILTETAAVTTAQVQPSIQTLKGLLALADPTDYPGAPINIFKIDAPILLEALERVHDVAAEAERVNAGISSGTDSDDAKPVQTVDIAAVGLDYQLAAMRAGIYTSPFKSGLIGGGDAAINGRTIVDGGPKANFYDVYGEAGPSAVANSQFHYGEASPVFIEDQPTRRGDFVWEVVKKFDSKLLVQDFDIHDFGDNHSLVLMVDSLSVQHALNLLQPEINTTTLNAISAASANDKATGFMEGNVDVGENNQGKADGNTLEALVNALARTYRKTQRKYQRRHMGQSG